jgi:hypothetical protein
MVPKSVRHTCQMTRNGSSPTPTSSRIQKSSSRSTKNKQKQSRTSGSAKKPGDAHKTIKNVPQPITTNGQCELASAQQNATAEPRETATTGGTQPTDQPMPSSPSTHKCSCPATTELIQCLLQATVKTAEPPDPFSEYEIEDPEVFIENCETYFRESTTPGGQRV